MWQIDFLEEGGKLIPQGSSEVADSDIAARWVGTNGSKHLFIVGAKQEAKAVEEYLNPVVGSHPQYHVFSVERFEQVWGQPCMRAPR